MKIRKAICLMLCLAMALFCVTGLPSGVRAEDTGYRIWLIITPEEGGTVTLSAENAAEGETVSISIATDPMFRLNELYVRNSDTYDEIEVTGGTFTMPAAEVDIFVDFERVSATITFDANGGTGTVPGPVVVPVGSEYTLPSSTLFGPPSDKTFAVWNIDVGTYNYDRDPGEKITVDTDITISPWWEYYVRPGWVFVVLTGNFPSGDYIAENCIESISLNGNARYAELTGTGTDVTIRLRAKDGYEISSSSVYSKEAISSIKSGTEDDGTYYIKYTQVSSGSTIVIKVTETCDVFFDANGGVKDTDLWPADDHRKGVVGYELGFLAYLLTDMATPAEGMDHYRVQIIDAGGNVTEYDITNTEDLSGYVLTGNTTIKYIWKVKTYKVSFDTGEGSGVEPQTVEHGKTPARPDDPMRDGYEFMGWYSDEALTAPFAFTEEIRSDTVLYASWEEVSYEVTGGAGSTWTKGSGKDLTITVKRNVKDEKCFGLFTGTAIDGTALTEGSDYTAQEGSTVVTLSASVLEALPAGEHTVTLSFEDGETETTVTIVTEVPNTGESGLILLWAALSAVFAALLISAGKEKRRA